MNEKNNNEPIKYRLIRSRRKTVSISVNAEGQVIVKAPLYASRFEIDRFINEKRDWIIKNIEKQTTMAQLAGAVEKLTYDELKQYGEITIRRIEPLLKEYASFYNVSYNRVTIRNQKTRWGSCSGKKNLNFNCLLAAVPDRVVKYVVVHELCHLIEMNHSGAFWNQVARTIPDYRKDVKWLKENGSLLIARLP